METAELNMLHLLHIMCIFIFTNFHVFPTLHSSGACENLRMGHKLTLCTLYALSRSGQYVRFLDTVGLIESDIVFIIFTSEVVQLTNCQFLDPFLSLELKSHILIESSRSAFIRIVILILYVSTAVFITQGNMQTTCFDQ